MIMTTLHKSIKFCLPLITKSLKEVTDLIEAHDERFFYFEVWLDYLHETVTEEFLDELISKYPGRMIFLFRRLNLDPPQMKIDKASKILKLLSQKYASVDLDVSSQQNLLSQLSTTRDNTFSLITSYHNYRETPSQERLQEIVEHMRSFTPSIYKIATYCQDQTDPLILSSILSYCKSNSFPFVILGMGQYGKITRISHTLFGNEMVFAPLHSHSQTAPDQLSYSEIKSILDILDKN